MFLSAMKAGQGVILRTSNFYKLEALYDQTVSSLGYTVIRIHPLSLMGQTPERLERQYKFGWGALGTLCPVPAPVQYRLHKWLWATLPSPPKPLLWSLIVLGKATPLYLIIISTAPFPGPWTQTLLLSCLPPGVAGDKPDLGKQRLWGPG